MRHRIVALAVAGVLAATIPAGAASPEPVPGYGYGYEDGYGYGDSPPPGPTAPPPGSASPDGEAWAWTQLTSGGTQIRYVSTDSSQTCPSVRYTYGGSQHTDPLSRRSEPGGLQFPTTVCEAEVRLTASDATLVPATVRAARLHPSTGQLPLPNWTSTTRPARIGVIGDTGCELPADMNEPAQDCANRWPFRQIADSVVDRTRPNLVVHVGDYLYREDPGRGNDNPAGCTGTADAASWACVVADFFRPAERLLATAPVVLARGNHEDCNMNQQGGAGGAWFRYLADELRSNGTCSLFSQPAMIHAGTLTLASVDSSLADRRDDGSTANQGTYTTQFNAVNQAAAQAPGDVFVVTHKPLWMVKAAGQTPGAVTWATRVLDGAVANTQLRHLQSKVRMVLSGHFHLAQKLDFDSTRPPQLTLGNSGGPLDNGPIDGNVELQSIGTPPQQVNQSVTKLRTPGGLAIYGYGDLRWDGTTWILTFRDRTGDPLGNSCRLSTSTDHRNFVC
ncbi:metallophosphoesterase [Streptomyces sp. NBC_01314]|uniref:metallophosphoesterase family protein n=1 Tax=Streptomyces sp. NBC_01314 TaxID=2903821 RepID=UPI0030904AB8|nr:metallophosphoesterase [Streptomyces sp. NBC_01314]